MAGLAVVSNTLIGALYARVGLEAVSTRLPLVLDIPLSVAAAGYLLGVLVGTYLSLVAIRTFVAEARTAFPDGAFTRNVPLAILNIVLGGLVYGLLVALGTVALLIPGIIAYLAFIFMLPYIAVEDRNFVDALQSSYRLSRGNWLSLFVLVVVLVSISGLLGGVGGIVFTLALGPTQSQAAVTLVQAPVSLYTVAVIAALFRQLRADDDESRAVPNAEIPSAPA